jgi:hypothetical protein
MLGCDGLKKMHWEINFKTGLKLRKEKCSGSYTKLIILFLVGFKIKHRVIYCVMVGIRRGPHYVRSQAAVEEVWGAVEAAAAGRSFQVS